MLGGSIKNEMMTKTTNKKSNNLTKKRIMGNRCTAIVNETKTAVYTILLYKKFITLICYETVYFFCKIYAIRDTLCVEIR
ncbi:hypothetical protein ABID23_000453 [Bartonella silvatica]|uniref:Uncharacterized protein n=1 Tax=Bartonella silvatica TaxID=357760 RepID=A0ABV2HFQ1_9HYPH